MVDIALVADPTLLRRWHWVDRLTHAVDHVALPADPFEEQVPRLSGEVGGERHELWLMTTADDVLAAGDVRLPVHDNLSAATVDVRVLPERRGAGHGRRLLEHLLDRVRARGRRRVFFEIAEPIGSTSDEPDPHAPGHRLARSVGARPVLAEVRRLLDLSTVSDSRLAELRQQAGQRADGYAVVQWADVAPEVLHGDLAALRARMSTDAPLGSMGWEPESWDADRLRAKLELARARGRRVLGTAARDERSGRLVGYTDIGVNASQPQVGYQWDTLVAAEHRGRRLGLLMKAANLQLLRNTIPAARYLNTWNAAVNRHMVAINDALGFQPVERWWEWQLDL